MITITRTLTLIFLLCTFTLVAGNAVTKPLSFDLYADIAQSQSSIKAQPSAVTHYNGGIVFSSDSVGLGRELWVKRGDSAPELLADINPGPSDSYPLNLKTVENSLYFTALNTDGGRRLWHYDSDSQLKLIDIRDQQDQPLHIRNYLVNEQSYFILGFPEDEIEQKVGVYHFSEGNGLTLIDSEFAEQLQRSEVANLFHFNGAMYAFLYSDLQTNACLLRRYPITHAPNQGLDFTCDELSYQHQAEVAGDKLYFTGKEQLLVFDGVNDPVPALPGGAPNGNLTVVNDELYVSTTWPFFDRLPGSMDMPFVYRVDETLQAMEMISTPPDQYAENVVLEIATAAWDDMLYVVESSGYWHGEYWVVNRTHLYRYNTIQKSKETLYEAELDRFGVILEHGIFLISNSSQLCIGEEFQALYCLDNDSQMQRQDITYSLDSVPTQLSVVDGELYFVAASDAQQGLWKSDGDRDIEFVEEGQQSKLVSWKSDLYRVGSGSQLERMESEVAWRSIAQSVASFPQDVDAMSFGDQHISMLIKENIGSDTNIEVWQFDGEESFSRILKTTLQGDIRLQTVADRVYISVSRVLFDNMDLTEQCAVYQVVDGDLHLLAEQQTLDDWRCDSWISAYEDKALIYFEYNADDVKHSSFASVSVNVSESSDTQVDWWWQDQPLHIFQFFPQAIQDDAIYFCGKGQLLGNTYFGTVKFSSDGVAEVVSDSCFTHVVSSSFTGQSALYLQMNNTPRLYRIQDGELSKVAGINSDALGIVRDMVEFDGDLVLSVQFSPDNVSYGHELVRVSVVNDEVVYADENQMDIHLTANAENYDIAQLLAALDSDEGDEILWALSSAPKHGSLTGLPIKLTSEGNMLEPESVSYKPHLGYVGRDTFEVTVSDGFSQSTMALNVTVSDVNTATINSDVRRPSGGSIGMLLLFLPIAIRRFIKGTLSVKSFH